MSVASEPGENPSWWIDLAIAVALVAGLVLLRPRMPDGDALGHAGRAIERSLLRGMEPKHILYAPLLRILLLGLENAGLRPYALDAFTIVSNLCGGVLYLLLARGIYAPLLRNVVVGRICALGVVLSFGVMVSCATIETYALALTLDVALAAVCIRTGLETTGPAAAAAVLFVLAVGVHATNVLMLPFVLAILLSSGRRHGWTAPGVFCGIVLLGAVVLASALVLGVPTADGTPNWARLIPRGDPHPSLSLGGRLGRALYGFLRTFAWLMPFKDLDRIFAIVYVAVFVLAALLIVFVAAHGFLGNLGRYRWASFLILLIVVPFTLVGIYYYASDSERWLFLMPPVWLVLGAIWTDYRPAPNSWLSPGALPGVLLFLVLLMGSYNALYKLWPEARSSRELKGLVDLQQRTGSGDLIVAASPLKGITEEFLLRQPLHGEVVALDHLMLDVHKTDVAGCENDMRERVQAALAQGRRVFVYGLLDEGQTEGRGYPWAWVQSMGYRPEKISSLLDEYHPEAVVKPDADHVGLFQLMGPAKDVP
jgi:hypothetical protein